MKIIKKLNIKKIFKSLKTGVLSTNIFFFICIIFFIFSFCSHFNSYTWFRWIEFLRGKILANVLVLKNQMRIGNKSTNIDF